MARTHRHFGVNGAGFTGRAEVLALVCLLAATAFSQTANNGTILGFVTDASGAAQGDFVQALKRNEM